jgi:hypothetical protein
MVHGAVPVPAVKGGFDPPPSTTRCVRALFTAGARRQTLFQDQLEHFYHRQLGRALVSVRQATRRRTRPRALRYHSAPSTEQSRDSATHPPAQSSEATQGRAPAPSSAG